MTDEAANIIRATADACRLARLCGCRVELEIRGGRFTGVGPIRLTITPDPLIAVTDIPPGELPPAATVTGTAAAPQRGIALHLENDDQP